MILDILKYPNKKLRTVAKEVEAVNGDIKQLVKDMFEQCMQLLVLVLLQPK